MAERRWTDNRGKTWLELKRGSLRAGGPVTDGGPVTILIEEGNGADCIVVPTAEFSDGRHFTRAPDAPENFIPSQDPPEQAPAPAKGKGAAKVSADDGGLTAASEAEVDTTKIKGR
jgi:hypothetical protein